MNTTNSPDPLDRKIDELIASQPLKPSADFTDRVLAATSELAASENPSHTPHPWLRLALPIAAVLVAAFAITKWIATRSAEFGPQTLSTIEFQEIFILEEGLTGLTSLQDGDLSDTDPLDTLIFLTQTSNHEIT